ncbi:hypothetical protein [Rhizobium sp. PP-CC-3G-465]|uniref:hypothetical protein n=1 Tax=Rhizobium sp. PP-CC-3G-465 TaxID=2135648 RepID=UPI001043EA64
MRKHIASPQTLQRMITQFCQVRIAPVATQRDCQNIRGYLLSLIARHMRPPINAGRTDWRQIADDCDLRQEMSQALKRAMQPGLDAIERWMRDIGEAEPDPAPSRRTQRTQQQPRTPVADKTARAKRAVKDVPSSRSPRTLRNTVSTAAPSLSKPGPDPQPIDPFPEPLFSQGQDPASFQEALSYQIRRFGETYYRLHKAVVHPGEAFDKTTLLSWITGMKTPRTLESLDILNRIEARYRLPQGYFKAKLPHAARAASGHDVGSDIGPAERRRLAWHLPDDFNSLPHSKREEILDWVRRVIITGATDYRRYQAAAVRQRYAIRFPGIAYGGGPSTSHNLLAPVDDTDEDDVTSIEDPDLLSGVIDAPPALAMEMADLVSFKTSTLTALGFQRHGVWGEETASQKIEHLGLMFGALAASPGSAVRGRGVPLPHLTFGMLVFPGIWDWYVQWRERRRGFYTAWEVDMLSVALSLTREGTGWLRQHPELLQRVRAVPGLISQAEIDDARNDWHAACERFFQYARHRSKEIQRVMRVHRDPFEPIMPVLEAASPLAEYRKITEEILQRMPDERRYPRAAAEAVRAFLMLRLGLHLGLRQKNLRQLLLCPRGHFPRSERRLQELKRGELRWNDRERGWEVLIPANAFKNAHSSFFGSKPFRLVLPDLMGLYTHLDAYVERHRSVLLGNARDPETFFVKTVKTTSKDAAYDQTTFYEAWRLTIQRYGIYNPYTGRGAIEGLLPHGPHNVRDVLATHILKQTGSYEQASYAIQDTPDMVARHYGRFLPQDKAALAAKILNQVWQAA